MSVFISLGILILAMLIVAILQLTPGVFMLFSHYAFGKYSVKKASDLSLFFIFGVECFATAIFLVTYIILNAIYDAFLSIDVLAWALGGVSVVLGIVCLVAYFRKGAGTRLFISRSLAKNFDKKARTAKNRSDAFVLGATSIIPELIFTVPLYIIAAMEIMFLGDTAIARSVLVLSFIIVAILPILSLYFRLPHYHLSDYLKFRFKNKTFFRIFLCVAYLSLAVLIFTKVLL